MSHDCRDSRDFSLSSRTDNTVVIRTEQDVIFVLIITPKCA